MIGSARQSLVLLTYVLARARTAGKATATRRALPAVPATRHPRPHPALRDQDPPGWLVTLARVVLVLAIAALLLATLLDGGDGLP